MHLLPSTRTLNIFYEVDTKLLESGTFHCPRFPSSCETREIETIHCSWKNLMHPRLRVHSVNKVVRRKVELKFSLPRKNVPGFLPLGCYSVVSMLIRGTRVKLLIHYAINLSSLNGNSRSIQFTRIVF